MIHTTTHVAGRRELVHVAVAGAPGGSVDLQARDAIARAVAEVEKAGVPAGHIVRSRLWGRDAEARTRASNVRLEVLAGQRRAASSSFIDPQRLPAGSDTMIELWALVSRAAPDAKVIREYDPPIPPPQLIVL